MLRKEDPRHVLIQEASHFGAECIFVGSRGLSRLESCVLGSVSSSVVSHADCSVEVVRSASR
jgi:nucleotide-binding universal stress UspA family protein